MKMTVNQTYVASLTKCKTVTEDKMIKSQIYLCVQATTQLESEEGLLKWKGVPWGTPTLSTRLFLEHPSRLFLYLLGITGDSMPSCDTGLQSQSNSMYSNMPSVAKWDNILHLQTCFKHLQQHFSVWETCQSLYCKSFVVVVVVVVMVIAFQHMNKMTKCVKVDKQTSPYTLLVIALQFSTSRVCKHLEMNVFATLNHLDSE